MSPVAPVCHSPPGPGRLHRGVSSWHHSLPQYRFYTCITDNLHNCLRVLKMAQKFYPRVLEQVEVFLCIVADEHLADQQFSLPSALLCVLWKLDGRERSVRLPLDHRCPTPTRDVDPELSQRRKRPGGVIFFRGTHKVRNNFGSIFNYIF